MPLPGVVSDENPFPTPETLPAEQVMLLPEKVKARLREAGETAQRNAERAAENQKGAKALLNLLAARAQEPRISSKERLQRLRRLADEWSKGLEGVAACKRGCSHCCHITVAVFEDEAKLIGKAIGVEPAPYRRPVDPERPYGYDRPCAFLQDGECSIYEHRPLACRFQFNMDEDPLLCELLPGVTVPVPYANATQLNMLTTMAFFRSNLSDLNDWFPNGKRKG